MKLKKRCSAYDCVIVGGGCVGASLALALAKSSYRILLIEKNQPAPPVEDLKARTLALSYASARIYSTLGIWESLQQVKALQQVLVTKQGQFGASRLKSTDVGLPALGYVVAIHELEAALYHALANTKTVRIMRPATIIERKDVAAGWDLSVTANNEIENITCQLLVAADGVDSILRKEQGIHCSLKEYGHYAVMTNVQLKAANPYTAIERFLSQGAIALLPWKQDYATLIWTLNRCENQHIKALADEDFLRVCQQQLGNRIGKLLKVGERNYFPLTMQVASVQYSTRFLLLGNSAHSLHPIAAQGLNLSLRDIWQLYSQISKSKESCDIGSEAFLCEYIRQRSADQQRIIFATDKIARYMSGGSLPNWLQALGITLFDCLNPIKYKFTRISMGLS